MEDDVVATAAASASVAVAAAVTKAAAAPVERNKRRPHRDIEDVAFSIAKELAYPYLRYQGLAILWEDLAAAEMMNAVMH